MSDYQLRFAGIGRLYGVRALEYFQQAHVCVVGIGGVGSWAAEALARSGVADYTRASTRLSARRATAAREFLIAQGVQASRISSIAYGKERPAALCDAEQCWSQNRRAVTVVQ